MTTHHLRKSLSTTLAWSVEVSELAKRRHMGHKPGADVFARVYTLDHPSLQPLLPVARLIEEEIAAATPTLMTPTGRRFRLGRHHKLQPRAQEIHAALAETGWHKSGNKTADEWLSTSEVAAELGLSLTYTRRLMASGTIPSQTTVDQFGNQQRRARLRDLLTSRRQYESRIRLRDIASELGCGYYPAYHTARRLKLEAALDERTGELVLDKDQAGRLRQEFARVQALHLRAIKVSAACDRLGLSYRRVLAMIRGGELVLDPETDSSGHRFVALASIRQAEADVAKPNSVPPDKAVVSLAVIRSATGMSRDAILALIRSGQWERRDLGDRLHVTNESLARWAETHRPDLAEHFSGSER